MNLPARFETLLSQDKLILPGDKVFAACSGGPDSTALFHLLLALRKKWKLKLAVIHFNHGLRADAADADEAFVRRLAAKNKVRFYCGSGKVGEKAKQNRTSIEEAAREERYAFFAKFPAKIALAHTLDDQAETVLMRMIQGTGPRGLSAIRKNMQMGKAVLVRPLLNITKKEILQYLRAAGIPFRKDDTNRSTRFLRNKIRHKLLPLLEREFNPRAVEALARIPSIVEEENEIFSALEEKAWKNAFRMKSPGEVSLRRAAFVKLPQALQFRLLERGLKVVDSRSGLNFEAWQRLKPAFQASRHRVSLPRDIDLELKKDRIVLYKKADRALKQ